MYHCLNSEHYFISVRSSVSVFKHVRTFKLRKYICDIFVCYNNFNETIAYILAENPFL